MRGVAALRRGCHPGPKGAGATAGLHGENDAGRGNGRIGSRSGGPRSLRRCFEARAPAGGESRDRFPASAWQKACAECAACPDRTAAELRRSVAPVERTVSEGAQSSTTAQPLAGPGFRSFGIAATTPGEEAASPSRTCLGMLPPCTGTLASWPCPARRTGTQARDGGLRHARLREAVPQSGQVRRLNLTACSSHRTRATRARPVRASARSAPG